MKKRLVLTREELQRSLDLRDDGVFVWKVSRGPKCRGVGQPAGNVNSRWGYLCITLHGIAYRANRLVWLWHHGEMPDGEVDHKDTDKLNNRIDNLRIATRSQNGANRHPQSNNTSGYKNVRYNKKDRAFEAFIMVDRKQYYLGRSKNPEDCARLYDAAAIKYFGEFARLNFPDEAMV